MHEIMVCCAVGWSRCRLFDFSWCRWKWKWLLQVTYLSYALSEKESHVTSADRYCTDICICRSLNILHWDYSPFMTIFGMFYAGLLLLVPRVQSQWWRSLQIFLTVTICDSLSSTWTIVHISTWFTNYQRQQIHASEQHFPLEGRHLRTFGCPVWFC